VLFALDRHARTVKARPHEKVEGVWSVLVGLGIAMALQPLPVLAVVLLLSTEGGLGKGWAFLFGELLVMVAIAAATIAVHGQTTRHSASRVASWVTLVAGIVLFALGAVLARRLRHGLDPRRPAWMDKLDRMQPWPAFLLGMFLPTYVIAVVAGAHIVGTHPGTAAAFAGVLVFLLVGTSTVYTPVLLTQFVPERSGPVRARLRVWLERYWRAVGAALLLVVGALLVAKGLVALG
jgi:Sap, sulfolipid-1-addressing protein